MNNYLIYQAYGKNEIIDECLFSLLSLRYYVSDDFLQKLQILIYTDRPDAFGFAEKIEINNNIIFEPITQEKIAEWRGLIDFVHRVKVEILKDATQKYQGKFLYLDTDTYFLDNPEKVFELITSQNYLMHLPEGAIGSRKNLTFKKLNDFLKKRKYTLPIGEDQIQLPADLVMWNAGVLGFCSDKVELFEKVLIFTDNFYQLYHKHIAEQLAFSYYMQTNLLATNDYVFHYWNFKEFRVILKQFFEIFADASCKECLSVFLEILPEKLMKNKLEYENLPFLQKTWRKIQKNKWQMPKVDVKKLLLDAKKHLQNCST